MKVDNSQREIFEELRKTQIDLITWVTEEYVEEQMRQIKKRGKGKANEEQRKERKRYTRETKKFGKEIAELRLRARQRERGKEVMFYPTKKDKWIVKAWKTKLRKKRD